MISEDKKLSRISENVKYISSIQFNSILVVAILYFYRLRAPFVYVSIRGS